MPHEAEESVDHYKFWILNRIPFERSVRVRGQFGGPRWITTIALDFIGNPVSKDEGKVRFPEKHLTGYTIQPPIPSVPEPRRRVVLSNQFTEATEWHLGDPKMLLVPAGKTFADSIPKEPKPPYTHYLCYEVHRGDPVNRDVNLSDQFDVHLGEPEIVGPLFPDMFAIPVDKNDEPMENEKVHLAIYRFQPRVGMKDPIYIRTSDQFLPLLPILESVVGPRFLAVPSFKLDWSEMP
jgi:hypothetical protein